MRFWEIGQESIKLEDDNNLHQCILLSEDCGNL